MTICFHSLVKFLAFPYHSFHSFLQSPLGSLCSDYNVCYELSYFNLKKKNSNWTFCRVFEYKLEIEWSEIKDENSSINWYWYYDFLARTLSVFVTPNNTSIPLTHQQMNDFGYTFAIILQKVLLFFRCECPSWWTHPEK